MGSRRSIGDRVRMGIAITRGSFRILRQQKWLFVFPVLYGLAWIIGFGVVIGGIFAALFGVGYGLAAIDSVISISEGMADEVAQAIVLVGSVIAIFITTSIATFFSAALANSVGKLFAYEPTCIRDGLAGAWKSKRTILAWDGVGAVGVIIRILENQEGQAARVVQSVIGFACSTMTFFIVPVIVFQEERAPRISTQ